MKIKTIASAIAIVATLGMGTAQAEHPYAEQQYYDYAKVIKVQPVYRVVKVNQPRRECWNERFVRGGYDNSATSTIVGGIIGGAIGNRFGKGRGRDAATIAGAILGGSIARDIHRTEHGAPARYVESRRVCGIRDNIVEQEQLDGYRVTYRYKGRLYTTGMNRDPGDRVRVDVKVSLAE